MTNLAISEENISKVLTEYSSYSLNWDAEGALIPSEMAIYNSRKFLNLIIELELSLPSVNLSVDGEINFIWGNPEEHGYVHIGFLNAGYSYYAINQYGKEKLKDSNIYNQEDFECLLTTILQKPKFRTL